MDEERERGISQNSIGWTLLAKTGLYKTCCFWIVAVCIKTQQWSLNKKKKKKKMKKRNPLHVITRPAIHKHILNTFKSVIIE